MALLSRERYSEVDIIVCDATPEGDIAAPVGSMALSTEGVLYTKASGTGNTGWADESEILTGNTIWVDAVNGDDTTGTTGRQDLPFLTPEAARDAAVSGDSIEVLAGSYTTATSLAKNGVNWFGYPGAAISMVNGTGRGIFDDNNTAVTCQVAGAFDLSVSDDGSGFTGPYGVASTRNVGSDIRIVCNSMVAASTVDNPALNACVWGFNGRLIVKANTMTGDISNCLYWENGDMFIECPVIRSVNVSAIATISDDAPTGKFWVSGQDILTSGIAAGTPTVFVSGSDTTAQVWINALEIRNAGTDGPGIQSDGASKLYVTAQKVGGSGDGNGVLVNNGQCWITAQKIAGGGTGVVRVDGGTAFVNCLQIEPGAADAAIDVTGGSLVYQGDVATIDGDGITISGGTARINGLAINTAASATSSPVVKSGGTLILNSCSLVAEATQDSIEAATAQSVVSYASYANTATDVNVTIDGLLTVGAYVQ